MNDLKTIRQLIKLMVDNDLTEIDLESEDEKIKLKRGGQGTAGGGGGVQYMPTPQAPAHAAPAAPRAGGGGGTADADADDDDADDGLITIDSPMVGTFYTASNPDSPPFAKKGDTVKPDAVVCIIEAMKVFNEIKAEVSGTIVEVLVDNGQSVEFGQPMFKVRP